MNPRSILLGVAVACAALVPAPCRAEAEPTADVARIQVWFQGGRSVVASSLEPVDDSGTLTRVALTEGGSITVPTVIVRRMMLLPPEPVEQEPVVAQAIEHPKPPEPGDLPLTCDPLVDPRLNRWAPLVEAAAARHGLDLNLVRAVMAVESCGEPAAVSPAGAVGLMQLMPATARDYGCTDRKDPARNIEAGCEHLARLTEKLDGRVDLVLAAYNAGEGAVKRWGGIPQYRETVRYVRLVRAHIERLAAAPEV